MRIIDQSFPSAFLQIAFMVGDKMVGQVFTSVVGNTFRAIHLDSIQRVVKVNTLDDAINFAINGETK